VNICFMNTIQGWGGGEKWHFENAIEAMNQGYNVYFIVNEDSKLLRKLQDYPKIKCVVFSFSKRSYLNPTIMLKLYAFFKKESIKVLLFNSIRDMNTGSFPAHRAKVKKIVLRYGWDHKVKRKIHTKLSFHYFVTDIFANSNWVKQRLIESKLLEDNRVDILHNGVKFNQKYLKKSVENSELILGFAGRLTFEKGVKPLLDVMEKLKGRPSKLIIAGIGPDQKKIEDIIVQKALHSSVEMLGFVENMEHFYSKIDVLIHLTYADGISNTVIEAMVAKKPIIAFNVASMPEIIQDGLSGFLVELDNLDAVIEAIEKFLIEKEQIEIFAQHSFQFAKENFDFNRNFNQLKQNYLL